MRLLVFLATAAILLPCLAVAAQSSRAPRPPFSPAVVAGDFVYLSGMLPTGIDGRTDPGDIATQTVRVLDNLSGLLRRSGSRLEQVAAVTVYLKHAADFAAMNEAYRKFWPSDPPARTTVIANLAVPEALIEISMVALKDGVERQVVHPASWLRSPNPYSYGIKSRDTLFLSGLISRNGRDNSMVTGDMAAQTGVVLKNAAEILEAAGMTLADVVSSRVYITDTARFQEMNAAYRKAFPDAPPARATVRAGLTGPDYLVEITMLAVKDAKRAPVSAARGEASQDARKPSTASQVPAPPLSPGILAGGRLFLSGMLGNTTATRADVAAQTRETMARIGTTLAAAGFGWGDVVDAVVYLPDLGSFQAMNAAYRQPFGESLPARATIEAGLVAPDGLVEIMMTAAKGEKRYVVAGR